MLKEIGASHLKRDKHDEVDLPGFTTAMDGGSAGAVGSGSSKNLEGLSRVKLIAEIGLPTQKKWAVPTNQSNQCRLIFIQMSEKPRLFRVGISDSHGNRLNPKRV
ncbi:MAG: hypothetical protein Q8K10_19640 [Methylobacter sp.]|nr:hypothetical protein [Methylobacter sp.]